jgi:histidinol-phosphate phosphatase family protein
MSEKPLILLDRDGTLIEERDYLTDPAQVHLLPHVVDGLKTLKRRGFKLVVVSNQSGVGRGLITRTELQRVNERFLQLLKQKKVQVDGLYWCPHSPSARCGCRKPKLGMVRRAAKKLHVSWRGSISVGDRPSDVELGQKTGGRGILVLTGYGKRFIGHSVKPDFQARHFKAAVAWIINAGKNRG